MTRLTETTDHPSMSSEAVVATSIWFSWTFSVYFCCLQISNFVYCPRGSLFFSPCKQLRWKFKVQVPVERADCDPRCTSIFSRFIRSYQMALSYQHAIYDQLIPQFRLVAKSPRTLAFIPYWSCTSLAALTFLSFLITMSWLRRRELKERKKIKQRVAFKLSTRKDVQSHACVKLNSFVTFLNVS